MLPSLRGQGAGRSQAFVILGIPGLALVGCTGVTAPVVRGLKTKVS